jgi:mannose-1-phosphate guanylyltransferase
MKALLLAAGLGTRLKPITNTIPKCLVPINGKPLLENLSAIGIDEFLINTFYLSEQVEKFVNSSKYKVTLVREDELFKSDNPRSCGIVELDKDNIVKKFYEKVENPPSDHCKWGCLYL